MPFDGTNFEQQDEVLDLLRRARDRVVMPDGWCQRSRINGNKVCALGALYLSSYPKGKKHESHSAELDALRLLGEALPAPYFLVWRYNDMPGRTQAEIAALYDRAIAKRVAKLQTDRMKA